ncbi:Hypothetical protein NTJ_01943 [Nesidiocoris tenuis]|uniref:BTB domain-containing protein n=1 Tax=Nesidiocoris tenuis TaxID=355587 RepID=A0ABN7AA14_9HEMI|nr:Hypothetical protein NTJ_01943 [Nesidiocoris tenuis]
MLTMNNSALHHELVQDFTTFQFPNGGLNSYSYSSSELTNRNDVMEGNCRYYEKLFGVKKEEVRYFHVFGEGGRWGMHFITNDDECYGVGYNGDFNLLGASGENFLKKRIAKPVKIDMLCGKGIKHISVGDHLATALGAHGLLYLWGLPFNEMRSSYDKSLIKLPHPMTSCAHFITELDCGGGHFAVITNRKQVFVWGYIDWRAPFSDGRLFSPMHKEVVSISCGAWHLVMLTSDGKPYTCGHGGYGQLGYDWSEDDGYWSVRKVSFKEPCVKAVAGSVSTMFITESGKLWACGLNHPQFGYLGINREEPSITTPEQVKIDVPISIVASSYPLSSLRNIYAAQSQDNTKIFVWGWGCESNWPQLFEGAASLIDVFVALPTPSGFYCSSSSTDSNLDIFDNESKLNDSATKVGLRPQTEPEDSVEEKESLAIALPIKTSESSTHRIEEGIEFSSKLESKADNCVLNNASSGVEEDVASRDYKSDNFFLNNLNDDRHDKGKALNNKDSNKSTARKHTELVISNESAYRVYLDYVYSGGSEHLDFDQLLDVFVLAVHYEENQLIEHTINLIKQRVSLTNFPKLLSRAQATASDQLMQVFQNFIKTLCQEPQKVASLIASFKVCEHEDKFGKKDGFY